MSAYIIAHVNVKDPRAYQEYAAQTPDLVRKFGGHFIVRGGKLEQMEGDWPLARVVVIEFDDMDKARAFYHSEEYAPVMAIDKGSGATCCGSIGAWRHGARFAEVGSWPGSVESSMRCRMPWPGCALCAGFPPRKK